MRKSHARHAELVSVSKLSILLIACLFYSCESNDIATNSVYIQQPVNRKVLVEFFTNAGCVPCVDVHHFLDGVASQSGVTINDSSVIIASFHWRFPDPHDSLYIQNSQQNNARAAYYGIGFTPNTFLDGSYMGQYSASQYSAQLNTEMNTTKYLNIGVTNVFDSTSDSGTVTVNILTLAAPPTANNFIYVLITESNINYTLTNGITNFDDVVRKMVNGTSGEQISLVQGQNVTYSAGYRINSRWNASECKLIVFIQDDSKKIYGVERIKVIDN
jgi:hypothetical protein